MRYYSHLLFAMVLIAFLNKYQDFMFLLFFILGSLIPDIDHSKSFFGRKAKLISAILKHREAMHSLLCGICLSLVILFFTNKYSYAFLLGFLSHLVLDSLNPKGIKWLWPLRFRVRGPIKTGSFIELIIDIFFVFILLNTI